MLVFNTFTISSMMLIQNLFMTTYLMIKLKVMVLKFALGSLPNITDNKN